MESHSSILVSAIITTHNRKDLLRKAINSVLCQTYDMIECIVIDDAGSDGTEDYIKDYINTGKIKYIYITKEESRGGNYARNIGIKAATGEYVAFLDDDDEWKENKIEAQIQCISDQVGFVYSGKIVETNFEKVYDDSINRKYPEGDLSKEILIHILTVTSTIMVKRSLLFEVGLFDENLKYWQEYDLCIRILQKTNVSCVSSGLVLYRVITGDKKRLSNKISGWETSVRYIEHKYKDLIAKLSWKDRAWRRLYICIDGFNRGKTSKSYKYMVKYGIVYPMMHPGIIVAFIVKTIKYVGRQLI